MAKQGHDPAELAHAAGTIAGLTYFEQPLHSITQHGPSGWRLCSRKPFPGHWGLQMDVWRHSATKDVIIAFRGTTAFVTWVQNLGVAFGQQPAMLHHAQRYVEQVVDSPALASAVSYVPGPADALIINPAGDSGEQASQGQKEKEQQPWSKAGAQHQHAPLTKLESIAEGSRERSGEAQLSEPPQRCSAGGVVYEEGEEATAWELQHMGSMLEDVAGEVVWSLLHMDSRRGRRPSPATAPPVDLIKGAQTSPSHDQQQRRSPIAVTASSGGQASAAPGSAGPAQDSASGVHPRPVARPAGLGAFGSAITESQAAASTDAQPTPSGKQHVWSVQGSTLSPRPGAAAGGGGTGAGGVGAAGARAGAFPAGGPGAGGAGGAAPASRRPLQRWGSVHLVMRSIRREDLQALAGPTAGRIILVGHSLGATLAELIAARLDLPAITFESTGLSSEWLTPEELAVAQRRIVGFLGGPNLVNMCHPQYGAKFRVFMPWVRPGLSAHSVHHWAACVAGTALRLAALPLALRAARAPIKAAKRGALLGTVMAVSKLFKWAGTSIIQHNIFDMVGAGWEGNPPYSFCPGAGIGAGGAQPAEAQQVKGPQGQGSTGGGDGAQAPPQPQPQAPQQQQRKQRKGGARRLPSDRYVGAIRSWPAGSDYSRPRHLLRRLLGFLLPFRPFNFGVHTLLRPSDVYEARTRMAGTYQVDIVPTKSIAPAIQAALLP